MALSPDITSFSGANNSVIVVDGFNALVQNANQPWSLTEPDSNTLQFSLHSGDHWSIPSWSDLTNNNAAERSEIAVNAQNPFPAGTEINVSYQMMIQPGPANTAPWLVLGQIHETPANGSPPFEVMMDGEHMKIVIGYELPGQTSPTYRTLWEDPNPIQRGHYYDMNIQVNFENNSSGFLDVWRDGTQIVDYNGPIAFNGQSYYFKEGVYRGPAPETITADFRNLQITTGAAPAPTPTQPTTPTTPTTPTNVAPTVTQASASPGTGTEHVGDTITLTLGFSEAVNVTGTSTLKLNDGNTATYVGGSGTSALTFKTTVASTDSNTSALAITGVNLPSGASIEDSSGVAANLAGAVKTFTGLQVDPTSPSSPTSVTEPVLTVADNTLHVTGGGGTVDLGAKVTTTDPNDLVAVNITGLPRYETITDNLDGQRFRGNNITLTAAQVDSGLVLHSYYRGSHDPVATLALTATAKDPVTGAVTTSAPQSITVMDPPPATATTTTSPASHEITGAVASPAPQPIAVTDPPPPATATTTASSASQGFAPFSQLKDLVAGGVATSAPQAITVTDHPPATGTTMASLASQSFALLNQYLAGNTGRVDPGQIMAAVSSGANWNQDSFLTKPQH